MTSNVGLGGQATFNMQHGFVEALIRGFRSGFLADETYHHLSQCDTLEVSRAAMCLSVGNNDHHLTHHFLVLIDHRI